LGKEFPVVSSLQKQLGRLCFSVSNGCSIGALIEEVRFAADSPLEGAVYCELVSESGFSA
jgi:hypothetical protein